MVASPRANSQTSLKRVCRFILNGLVNANQILGEEVFNVEDWRVIGEYVYDDEGGRHQAFYSPVHDAVIFGETIKAHERIQVEQSLKYSQPAATKLWNTAGLTEVDKWEVGEEYGESMIPGFVLCYTICYLRFLSADAEKSCDTHTPRLTGNKHTNNLVTRFFLLFLSKTDASRVIHTRGVRPPAAPLGVTKYLITCL